MLVTNAQARDMLCPFKFSHVKFLSAADAQALRTNPVWICEGPKCMAWQKVVDPLGGENGYCGLAERPIEIQNK